MQYRILRLKESLRNQFRTAPHTSGQTLLKPKDYEPQESVEASNPYAAWQTLKGAERPLLVGDVLEAEGGKLEVFKFIGFEPAEWILPEQKAPAAPSEP